MPKAGEPGKEQGWNLRELVRNVLPLQCFSHWTLEKVNVFGVGNLNT